MEKEFLILDELKRAREKQIVTNDFSRISRLINDYNFTHPNEMLDKTPDELEHIYRIGLFAVIVDPQREITIAHAALWPLLDYDSLRLVEFGSWIADPKYRHHRINRLTLGELIGNEIINSNPNLPIIATVKRINSLKGLQKIGGKIINFYDFPTVSALTCVCQGSSEHFGFPCCTYRRKIDNGLKMSVFKQEQSNLQEPHVIPCTLIGFNIDVLSGFEHDLQQRIGLPNLSIGSEYFQKVFHFFNSLGINIL